MIIADWWPWVIVGSMLIGVVAYLLYRRTEIKPGWRWVLIGLRVATTALLGLALAGLSCVTESDGETAPVGLLIDSSASMELRDGNGRSRADEAARLAGELRRAHPGLEFVELVSGEENSGDSAVALARLYLTRPELAAAVLIGDDAVDNVFQRSLYPLHSLAVEKPSDFDLELDRPRGPRMAVKGRAAQVEIDVRGRGTAPDTALVGAAVRHLDDDSFTELESVEVSLSPSGEPQTAEFIFTPGRPGWWLVEFELSEIDGEATPRNNHRRLLVYAERGELSALVLAQTPSPEAAFLSRALEKIPGVEVEYLHHRPDGSFYSPEGERRRADAVSPDALFFIDLVPDGSLLSAVSERNDAGRGTAFLWGRPGLSVPASDPVWALLPFGPLESGLRLVAGQSRPARTVGPLFDGVDEAGAPAVLSFAEGFSISETAVLELENPAGRVVPGALAARSGAPRILLLGNGWWRWHLARQAGEPDVLYQNLIGDMFAFLVTDTARQGARIELARRRSIAGEKVTFEVVASEEPSCRLLGGDDPVELTLDPAGESRWRGGFTAPSVEGLYSLEAAVNGEIVTEPLIVEPPLAEFRKLTPDVDALERLAVSTGGTLLQGPDEDIALSPTARSTLTEENPLRTSFFFLGAVVVLLGMEWYLRRRLNLR